MPKKTVRLPSQEDFAELVHDALSRLYDSHYLQKHPLSKILVDDTEAATLMPSQSLRRVLLEAIQAMRPESGTPAQSPDWRSYRVLELRYIEGLNVAEVMDQLGLAKSQYFREQSRVLDMLSTILWNRLLMTHEATDTASTVDDENPNREILAQSALEHLLAEAKWETLDVVQLMDEMQPVLAPLAMAKQVSIQFGNSSHPVNVCADRVMLRQSLIGLGTFALNVPGVKDLKLVAFRDGDETGIRIVATPVLAKGTEITHVEVSQKDSLYISQQLIVAMGGNLRLEPQSPNGWQATVSWSRQKPDVLLVVDDTPDFGNLCYRYLATRDWQVISVSNSDDARQVILETKPTVIVLDVMMPDEDGWEILMRLKSDPKSEDIPVIICSVLNEPQLGRALGAVDYLTKPVSQQALLQALAPWGQRRDIVTPVPPA